MKKNTFLLFLLTILLNCVVLSQDQIKTSFEIDTISNNVFKIKITKDFEVNSVVFIGEDGILMVDAGMMGTAIEYKDKISELSKFQIKYLINTHAHLDHIGGNFVFTDETTIIAHQKVKDRMNSGIFLLYNIPQKAQPNLTLNGEMTLYETKLHQLNKEDERIKLEWLKITKRNNELNIKEGIDNSENA